MVYEKQRQCKEIKESLQNENKTEESKHVDQFEIEEADFYQQMVVSKFITIAQLKKHPPVWQIITENMCFRVTFAELGFSVPVCIFCEVNFLNLSDYEDDKH